MINESLAMQMEIEKTLAHLNEKLLRLEEQTLGKVRTVAESVNDVKETLDLRLRVRHRPWTYVAGASALGFAGAYWFGGHKAVPLQSNTKSSASSTRQTESAGNDPSPVNGATYGPARAESPVEAAPGWLTKFGDRFEPEIAELRGLIIGTLLGVAREIIVRQAMKPERSSVQTDDVNEPQ